MRSFAFILLTSLALARPHAKASSAKAPPVANTPAAVPATAKPQKQLKSLAPASQMQKAFARDAEDVRVLILASPT